MNKLNIRFNARRSTLIYFHQTLIIMCCLFVQTVFASEMPWLKSIGAEQRLDGIHTIASVAKVSVFDGLTYTASTLFHDHQRAIFKRKYSDREVTHGVEGKYVWRYDGKAESEVPAMMTNFVLGHQIHAQILFFERLHLSLEAAVSSEFNGQKVLVVTSQTEEQTWHFYYKADSKLPLGMKLLLKEQKPIIFTLSNYKSVDGISLPFRVSIDDGSRQFQYNYDTIAFNTGNLADFRAPDNKLNEQQRLLRRHRMIMDDHYFGRTTDMKTFTGDDVTIVSGGEVYPIKAKDSNAHMDKIMGNRNYTVYDDLIRPIVKISEDGTLGWVIVQISAKGVRLDANGKPTEDLAFVSAWIELYQKVDKQWRMVGNVSNFK